MSEPVSVQTSPVASDETRGRLLQSPTVLNGLRTVLERYDRYDGNIPITSLQEVQKQLASM